MVRPSKLCNWAETAAVGDIVEPTEVKKSAGWEKVGGIPEKPPYQYFNYWQNSVYNWVNYLDSAVTALATQDLTLRVDTPTLAQTLNIGDTNAAIINFGKTGGTINMLGKVPSILLSCALAGITTLARANSANANAVTIPDYATNTLASVNNAQTFTGLQTFTDSIKLLNKAAAANTFSWQTGGTFSFGTGATITEAGAFGGITGAFTTSTTSPSHIVSSAGGGSTTITRVNSATSYTATLPAATSTLAALDIAQTFSLVNTFSEFPVFSKGLSVTSTASGASAGNITRYTTTWNFGGVAATITEAGAFGGTSGTFSSSVTTPLLISTGAFELRVNTSLSALNITTAGLTTIAPTSFTGSHVLNCNSTRIVAGGTSGTTRDASIEIASFQASNNYGARLFFTANNTGTSSINASYGPGATANLEFQVASVVTATASYLKSWVFGTDCPSVSIVNNGGGNDLTSNTALMITTNGARGDLTHPKTLEIKFLGVSNTQLARIYAQDKTNSVVPEGLFFETYSGGIVAAGNFTGTGAINFGPSGITNNHQINTTTALVWGSSGSKTAGLTVGDPATGSSLWINTPSLNTTYPSGFAVNGGYSSSLSTIRIFALGVCSGGGYQSAFEFYTTSNTSQVLALKLDASGSATIGASAASTNTINGPTTINGAGTLTLNRAGAGNVGSVTFQSAGVSVGTIEGRAANGLTFYAGSSSSLLIDSGGGCLFGFNTASVHGFKSATSSTAGSVFTYMTITLNGVAKKIAVYDV